MIRHDTISRAFIVSAIMAALFLLTFEQTIYSVIPLVLLGVSLSLERFLENRVETDVKLAVSETKQIMIYTVFALIVLFFMNQNIEYTISLDTTTSVMLYTFSLAVAEEAFFRGCITDLCLSKIKNSMIALFVSAGIFAVYHLARYGNSESLMFFVLGGGLILNWIAFKTRRISPSILAHVIYNLIVVANMGVMAT